MNKLFIYPLLFFILFQHFLRAQQVDSLLALGDEKLELVELDEALILIKAAARLNQLTPKQPDIRGARINLKLGRIYLNFDSLYQAEKVLVQAAKIFENENQNVDLADCYYYLGTVYWYIESGAKGLEYYEKALATFEAKPDATHKRYPMYYADYGTGLISLGRAEEAKAALLKSIKLSRAINGERDKITAICYNSLGIYYNYIEDYYQARNTFKKMVEVLEYHYPEGNHPNLGSAIGNLALVLKNLNDHAQALSYLNRTYSIFDRFLPPNHRQLINVKISIADVYLELEKFEQAQEAYQEILDNAELSLEKEAGVFLGIGLCKKNLGEVEESIPYLKKAVDVIKEVYDTTGIFYLNSRENLAAAYAKNGQYEKGLRIYEQAKKAYLQLFGKSHIAIARVFNKMAKVEELRKNDEISDRLLDSALAFFTVPYNFEEIYYPKEFINFLWNKGESQFRLFSKTQDVQHLKEAFHYCNLTIDYLDYQRVRFANQESKKLLNEGAYKLFDRLVLISYEMYKVTQELRFLEQCFQYSEKGKSQLLLESMKEAELVLYEGLKDSLQTIKKGIQFYEFKIGEANAYGEPIFEWEKQRYELEQQYQSMIGGLKAKHPEYFEEVLSNKNISIATIQEDLLTPQSTILSYHLTADKVFIFVINYDDFQVVSLPRPSELGAWVKELRHQLKNRSTRLGKLFDASGNLYDVLIKPVEQYLKPSLIIIPHDRLGYIPFEALIKEKPSPREAARMQNHAYLIKDYRISYNYAVKLLKTEEADQHTSFKGTLISFAPFYKGDTTQILRTLSEDRLLTLELSSLDYSGEEALAIKDIWGGAALLGKQATRAKFEEEAERYKIIHLATHGKADDQSGDYSFMAFSKEGEEANEILFVRDLYALSLNADLVVLSACETAIGELQKGEGIISMARAFTYAGAKSIVTSLWSVSDDNPFDRSIG